MRPRSVHGDWLWLTLILILLLSACSSSKTFPKKTPEVSESEAAFSIASAAPKAYYTVKPGDNLYSIGLIYDRDYRQLAQQNKIRNPHRIYPGQRIAIPPQTAYAAQLDSAAIEASPASTPQTQTANHTSATPAVASRPIPTSATPPAASDAASEKPPRPKLRRPSTAWVWPADGPITHGYGKGNKGINIGGSTGQPIRATAEGQVVYSGSGLSGYGKLIILRHSKDYLSAYAHNHAVHVNEGDSVAAGQHISDMGHTGTDRVMLHFELRKRGQPLNPEDYLPKR